MKEIENIQLPSGKVVDARILEALAKDRYGIAYAKLLYTNPQVKALALGTASGASVAPSKADVQRRSYTLTLNRDPAKPLDPKLQEFLRYVLSADGQQEVLHEGGYFPLSAKVAREQSRKLEPAQ